MAQKANSRFTAWWGGGVPVFLLCCLAVSVMADLKSNTGSIKFDTGSSSGSGNMVLNGNGLGIGTTSAQANLHVMGNAVFQSSNLGIGTTSPGSTLDISGTMGFNLQSASSNTTLSGNSVVLGDTSSANVHLTLPYAGNVSGRMYYIKKVSSSYELRVKGGGNAIDNESFITLTSSSSGYPFLQVTSNGANWYILALSGNSYSDAVSTSNLVGYLRLEESSGNSAGDGSGNANTGTLNGGFTFASNSTTGKVGNALDFDGTNDYVQLADSNSLDLGNTGTIAVWIKFDTLASTVESGFSSWTTLTAPNGAGAFNRDGMKVDMTIVGEKLYFASYLHDGNTTDIETFQTASVNADFTGQSAWTTQTAPDGAGADDSTSVALDSDGTKLYYAAFAHSDATEVFYTASSNLDGTGFSSWTSQTAPNGAADNDKSGIDMVVVGSKMYFAAFLHTTSTEAFLTASSNLDGTGMSAWTSQTAPDGAGSGETSSVGMDSNGERLYYAAFTHTGGTATFNTAYSNLDGTGFSSWTTQTAPGASGGGDDSSHTALAMAGNTLYVAVFAHDNANDQYDTARCGLEGTGFSGWTTRTDPGGVGSDDHTNPAIVTDGKKLYYSAFAHDDGVETLKVASALIASRAIISKIGAYELLQSGNGFFFDWAGPPRTFGTTSTGTWVHLALTHDGSNLIYYINGSEVRREVSTTDFTSNGNVLKIGGEGNYFDGAIDDVRIYTRALSAAEVQDIYNLGN